VALLDPAHPDNGRLRRELPPRVFRNSGSDLAVRLRTGNTVARLHLMGLLKPVIMGAPPFTFCRRHPPAARRAMWRHLKRAQAYQAALAEYEELEFQTVSGDLDALGPFPEVPLRVLVHDPEVLTTDMSVRLPREEAAQVEGIWGELLREQASLSPLGRVQTAGGSGHLIHLEKPDLVVVDPPRAGLSGKALRRMARLEAPRIVYVSCNPTTLAANVKTLGEDWGYRLERVQPVDMFPHTPHVECVSALVRD
jgi:hypothetical protein